jgi:solute carrier family 4 (anion exchanger) protein 1
MSIDLSTRSTTYLVGDGDDHLSESTPSASHTDSSKPKMFAGVFEEYNRRWPHMFSSDYYDFFLSPSKTLSASIFMFFATIFSTIALGAHLSEVGDYGEYIGVGEFLVMNSLSGLYFSVVSCQPLMILRPTGPITLIIENIIIISEKYSINFWHLLACIGYFVGNIIENKRVIYCNY